MTRLEALEQLVRRCEMGGPWTQAHTVWSHEWVDAFNGSLDAAKALHDAVLPDWFVARLMEDPEGKGWTCHLEPRNAPSQDWIDGDSDSPARAWLLAILKALIAEEQDK